MEIGSGAIVDTRRLSIDKMGIWQGDLVCFLRNLRTFICAYGSGSASAGATEEVILVEFQVEHVMELKRLDSYFQEAYVEYAATDEAYIVVYDVDNSEDIAVLELVSGENKNGGAISGKLYPGISYQILIRVTSTDATNAATPPAKGNVVMQLFPAMEIVIT